MGLVSLFFLEEWLSFFVATINDVIEIGKHRVQGEVMIFSVVSVRFLWSQFP